MNPMRAPRTSLQIQNSVVFALLMRELKTRFGKYRLGYAWALLEPLSHVLVLTAILGSVSKSVLPGIEFPIFLVTGILPWLLFSDSITQGMAAVTANEGLFGYRQVKPIDAVIARLLLEALVLLATYLCLLGLASWAGYEIAIRDPLHVFCAMSLLFVFSAGLGLMASIAGGLYQEAQKFVPMALRPLYFASGIFFSLDMVPPEYRPYLLWNPVLHATELSREAFFASFETAGGSWLYLSLAAVVSLSLGLAMYRRTALRLVTT
jgi:capsular polysaccharide transport system permease protein